ncbi:TerC family protein [Hyphobacterium indicum]|uniref:TerC family protein n=1 Tax=Hyphobacterium indicum TaxID=2162714 RepID=UPI000D6520BF|nr:TerC family protein [Hyphobacterium indicum]
MIEMLTSPEVWMAFATLTFLEIVLGIDNIVFIAVIASRLEESRRALARQIGLGLALIFRIIMLFTLVWLARLETDIFSLFGNGYSWRDIILVGGGLFLLVKATLEIHHSMEPAHAPGTSIAVASFTGAVAQIALIDVVFSLDSIITAVGMTDRITIMIAAVVVAIGVMIMAAGTVGRFIERHPTTKMLALSFLLLIGVALVADGLGFHIPRGYIYFAIAFSLMVEVLNILARRARQTRA